MNPLVENETYMQYATLIVTRRSTTENNANNEETLSFVVRKRNFCFETVAALSMTKA